MTQALGILMLIAMAAGAGFVLFRPQWTVVLVLTLFPLKQLMQSYLPAFAVNSPLFNFMVFGVVVLAVVARVLRRDGAFSGYINRFSVTLWILYLFALFGLAYTPARASALELVQAGAPYWLMMVFLLPLVLVTLDDFRRILPAYMLVGTIVCILIFINPSSTFYRGRLVVEIGQSIGIGDLRGSPLITATMGAQVALVAFLYKPERPNLFINLLRITALVAGIGLAVVSGSRGNAVFAVMVAIMCYPLARRVADFKQFLLTTGAFGALAGFMLVAFRFFLGRDSGQSARWDITRWQDPIQERFGPISQLFEAYASSPGNWLFGLGTNAYAAITNIHRGYSHNLVAELLCEHGLIGLGLFGLASFLALGLARNLWRMNSEDPSRRAAVATLLALCLYMLMLQMKEGTFVSLPSLWVMWIMMAKIATHERKVVAAAEAQQAWDEYEAYSDDDEAGGYGYGEGYGGGGRDGSGDGGGDDGGRPREGSLALN